jgi:hypothetical protein
MKRFANEINEIALFAKRINFNPNNDCIVELTRLWLEDNRKAYKEINENKEKAINILKRLSN